MRKSKIPTILGVLILTIGLVAGVFLVQFSQIFRLGAAGELAPKDVRISNVTDNSFTVSWVTDKETAGFIKWGTSESSLDKEEIEGAKKQTFIHSITLRALKPETSYFFSINSGGRDFDNNGVTWQTKTGSSLPEPPKTLLVSGSVLTATGAPAKEALLYISVGGGSLLSTLTSESGSWLIPISSARTQDLTSFINPDEKTSLMEISVNAGPNGVSTAQIYPQSAKPSPSIILGQVHDFKNLPASEVSEIPKASIGVPEESTPSSGFEVGEKPATPSSSNVTIQSVEENEIITSTNPEFFGEGPAGTTITITVESEAQTTQIRIPSDGEWNWSPPAGLSEGTHTITLSWRDASGVLRTLKRTFIVQAAEGPAFVSTPSASASPSASPSPSPKVSPTPSPSATVSATPTSTASAAPIPQSGSLTPTILLSIMGLGIFAVSILIWKQSNA